MEAEAEEIGTCDDGMGWDMRAKAGDRSSRFDPLNKRKMERM